MKIKASELIRQLNKLTDAEKELEVWVSDEYPIIDVEITEWKKRDGTSVLIVELS